jgi:hypothetical protein
VHAVGEIQDTPKKTLLAVPDPGLGLGTIDQLVPSQDSIKVPELLLLPAAVHAVAETQDTPKRPEKT